jgi:4'-phosphopantetheinyl transferase EntD
VEVHDALPMGVLERISTISEHCWLDRKMPATMTDHTHWDRVLFSAKESVFKAWFPQTRIWLEFCDVKIEFEESHCRFRACVGPVGRNGTNTQMRGRFFVERGLVLTAVCVRRRFD